MADTKISALTAVVTPAGTDELAVNQAGDSKKLTVTQLLTLAISGSGTPVDNQLAIFTDADTIEGDAGLTWDGSSLSVLGSIVGQTAGSFGLLDEATSDTNPTLLPNQDDPTIGIGGDGANTLSLVVSGISGFRLNDFAGGVVQVVDANTSVTAFAGGGQASATALINSFTVVDAVVTIGDSVKLPGTFFSSSLVYIKNDAANSCDVFPASGDDLGAGTNTAEALAGGDFVVYIATGASSTWTKLMGGTA